MALNPYLPAQTKAIEQQANQNLQTNLLPSINSGAVAAGGFGGSRQGIAQGLATGQTQQGISNALGSMYGNAYAEDQRNNTAMATAKMQADSQRYSADSSAKSNMYGSDNSLKSSMYGADSNYNIAGLNNETNRQGNALNYNLGLTNAGNTANANLMDFYTKVQGNNNNYNLGLGQNQNQATANANNYDLGLRSNDLGYANLDSTIAQRNFDNQMTGANFGLDAYNTLMNGNNLGLTAGNAMQNTPMNYFNNFSQNANAIGNGFGTTTTGSTSNNLLQGLGMGQYGAQLFGGSSGMYSDPTLIPMQPGGGL